MGSCLLALWLLYRRVSVIGQLARYLSVGVLGAILLVIVAGLSHFNTARAFTFPPGAFHFSAGFITGLGSAMLVATYDYWGYYNVCFLGAEIKQPERNIPRAILFSIRHCWRAVPRDERQHSGRSAVAGAGPDRRTRVALLHCFNAAAAHLRNLVGDVWRVPDHVDGVRLRVFTHARLLARSLRRGAGRKLIFAPTPNFIPNTNSLTVRCSRWEW